eukprot:TRINITY_DN66983_c0_g1_i1.p1 TRINITY_DN66983_c0_g1~~TRINITY_DN66983_c0_g1_i1.p1  ORF type:complete len:175 (+),score=22.55 TRINITY_DN66983_c0_g1_i1:70-594(+)
MNGRILTCLCLVAHVLSAKHYMFGYFSDSNCTTRKNDTFPEYFSHERSSAGSACFKTRSRNAASASFSLTCATNGQLRMNWYRSSNCTVLPDDKEITLSEDVTHGGCVASPASFVRIFAYEIDQADFPNCSAWPSPPQSSERPAVSRAARHEAPESEHQGEDDGRQGKDTSMLV